MSARGQTSALTDLSTDATAAGDGKQAEPPDRGPHHGVTRRSLLKDAGLVGVAIVVSGAGVVSWRVVDNGVVDSGAGRPYDPWDHWRDDPGPVGMVAAAVLAANPHNAQPWIFRVEADRIDLFSDPTRRMMSMDALMREHYVGLGCALENLVLAAAARGYAAETALAPDPGNGSHVARIALTHAAAVQSPLHEAIGERHSNRGPYLDTPISGDVLEDLSANADGLTGTQVHWLADPADKASMSALIIDTTQAVIDDQQQSVESFSWFRNNRDDIVAHADGLTLDGQGLGAVTLAAAKILPASSRVAGDQFWLAQTRTVHTATAAAYGIITVTDVDDLSQRLTGGRLLERVHLAATVRGLGLQHMNQVTERVDSDRAHHRPGLLETRLHQLTDRFGGQPLVAFRIGYPVRTARLSPRRAVSSVLR
jgi:hypothetical protein